MKNYKLKVSITDFGAVAGTLELQTKNIQSAIDYCFKMGGGEIQIPSGEFVTGGIRLRSNTTLRLLEGAKLIGSRNPDDYYILKDDVIEPVSERVLVEETRVNGRSIDGVHFGRKWFNSLIKVYRAKNVSIIGEKNAVINGMDCYDSKGEEGFRGPHCICVCECKNLLLKGYFISNSANWAHCIWDTKNITCENVTINGGHDGFDFFACKNVKVKDCDIYSGDDCVAGYANEKVLISNCRMSSTCSAFRFAGTKVKITNCIIDGNSKHVHRYFLTDEEKITGILLSDEENPKHRYRMKSFYTYYADNRLKINKKPSKILLENCVVNNPEKFLHYNYSGNEIWQKNRPLYDIKFKNITVKNISLPMIVYADEENPLKLEFETVRINLSDDYNDDCIMRTANLKKVKLNNFIVENFDGNTIIKNYGKNNAKVISNETVFDQTKISNLKETNESFVVDVI